MLLFCRKNNAEVSTYSVLTPTFIIEPKRLYSMIENNKMTVPIIIGTVVCI